MEIDFTKEILASSPSFPEDEEKALSFFFALFSGKKDGDESREKCKKVFAPYLKPRFPSIGFTPFPKQEWGERKPGERLRKSYLSFLRFLGSENTDIQRLFLSIRNRITYLLIDKE